MQSVDTMLHARWVVPAVPEGAVLEDHCVVMNEGILLDVLPSPEANSRYKMKHHNPEDGIHEFEKHHVLIPGLVNAHTHAAMTLLRGYADDIGLMRWLQSIWAAEKKWVSEEFVRTGSELGLAEMIRCGVTCFNDMYFFPEITAQVADNFGMRANIGIPVLMFPNNWASGTDEALEKGRKVYETYKDHNLVKIALAPHAPYTLDDDSFRKVDSMSKETGMKVHCHVHETEKEVNDALASEMFGRERPITRLQRLGLFDSRLIAVHMTQLTEEEIEVVSKQNVSVVHCPESNLKLCSGICPVKALQRAGVNVCLGTDGAAANDDLDLLGELRTAALVDKMQAHDATAVPAASLLSMATINGAKALGMDQMIGSLEKGKQADVVAIRLRTEPVFNPITNLVYVGTNSVTDVWIAGKRVLSHGKLTCVEEKALLLRCKNWASRIAAAKPALEEEIERSLQASN